MPERDKNYLLYTANDDLGQRIDQGLHHLAGVDRAENPTPEIEAVDVLPVVDRLEVLLQKRDEHKDMKTGHLRGARSNFSPQLILFLSPTGHRALPRG